MNLKKENQLIKAFNRFDVIKLIQTFLSELIEVDTTNKEIKKYFKIWLGDCLIRGSGIIVKDNAGILHLANGTRTGALDDFGFGSDFIATTKNGNEYTGVVDVDGVFIYPYTIPEKLSIFDRIADNVSEIEQSKRFLIKYARLAPVFSVQDSKTKNAISEIITSIFDGNMTAFVSENILKSLIDGKNVNGVEKLDIFEPNRIADLMTLENCKQLELKALYELFGLPKAVSIKKAQETEEETGANGNCYLLPLVIYRNFCEFADQLKTVFNIDISFKLNVLILKELERYFNQEAEQHATGENITDELDPLSVSDSKPLESEQGTTTDSGGSSDTDNKSRD